MVLRRYQIRSKKLWKNGHVTGVVCTSGYDPQKLVREQTGKVKDQEI